MYTGNRTDVVVVVAAVGSMGVGGDCDGVAMEPTIKISIMIIFYCNWQYAGVGLPCTMHW